LIGYYVVANAFGLRGALGAGSFLLAAYGAAYLGEIFRAAVEGVPASQREAARAVGFDRWQTWRQVVLPQAMRRALPATTGQLVTLVKDSSLLSVLGLAELTQQVRMANSASASALEGYLPLLGAYLVMTLPLGWLSRWLEGRWRVGDGT
jgi:polar amino acid transport system permease protein